MPSVGRPRMEGTYDDGRASTAPSARAILRAGADGAVDARQERASVYLWTGARWGGGKGSRRAAYRVRTALTLVFLMVFLWFSYGGFLFVFFLFSFCFLRFSWV